MQMLVYLLRGALDDTCPVMHGDGTSGNAISGL